MHTAALAVRVFTVAERRVCAVACGLFAHMLKEAALLAGTFDLK